MQVGNRKSKKGFLKYFWYPILIANAFTVLALFLSVMAWYISPRITTIFAYIGMAFPFLLLLNVLFMLFWSVFFQWKFALLSFISLLVCIHPVLTYFPIHFQTKKIPENYIKILSYNVEAFKWGSINKTASNNQTIDYILKNDADIICLQEYMAPEKVKGRTTNDIKKILKKYPYHTTTALYKRMGGYTYGLACFSKFPIVSSSEIPIESEVNGAVMYKININGKIISVINCHLESNRLTNADKEIYANLIKDANRQTVNDAARNMRSRLGVAFRTRAPQAEMIAEWVKINEADGVIVCGDFNDTPISYTYKTVKGDLIDSYAATGFGPTITYHENYFWFRIDFIMHTKDFKSYNTTVDKVKHSDHYPIWTYLKIDK